MPRDEVADGRVARFPPLLCRPFADRIALLPKRERHPRDIRRDARDRRAAGGDADQERHLRFGGQRRDRRRDRRQDHAGQQLHMLAGNQLLRQPFADLRGGGVIPAQDLDLHIGREILLVLLDVEVDRLLRLIARLRDKAGIAADQPDFDDRLRRCRHDDQRRERERPRNRQRGGSPACHCSSPLRTRRRPAVIAGSIMEGR